MFKNFSVIRLTLTLLVASTLALVGCGSGGGESATVPTYTLSGRVSGLLGTGLVLQNNNADDLAVTANGAFTFAKPIAAGATYNVTVKTQPGGPAQTCTVGNGSGTATSAVTSVIVTCSVNTYTVGGTVTGLIGSGLVLQNNNAGDLAIAANGAFTFATPVAVGASYSVTVKTQPSGQTCTVGGGSGTSVGANVTNVTVTCSVNTYTVGGSATGLIGTGLVLQNNNADDLAVTANGAFTFGTPVAVGASYSVTVRTQPSGQTCSVGNGSGTSTSAVTNVTVTCSVNTYTVGGTVTGLIGTGLVLQNNNAGDLAVTANGAFTFGTPVAVGASYSVTVKTQPSGQTCSVGNGSGTSTGANVTNVTVTCSANTYTVGGTVSGLSGTGLVLQNNNAGDLAIVANGAFTFATPVAAGATYSVTVKTQPSGPTQTCTVGNGSGTAGANISNVTVNCVVNTYTVGGTVSGLTGSGLVLQNNNSADLAIAANGAFTFATPVAAGTTYNVTVKTQPTGPAQTCTVGNASGTAGANVSNVTVTCSVNTYTVGGTVTGLIGTGLVLQNNNSGDLSIASNGAFTFATPVAAGASYSVTVKIQPSVPRQKCTVGNGTGTASSAVSNVTVTCVVPVPRFAYTASVGTDEVWAHAIDPTTGALTYIGAFPAGTGPIAVTVDPTGRFLYAANVNSNNVSAFAINTTTGTLTSVGATAAVGRAYDLAVDPDGRFVYGVNFASALVSAYTINATTGALTTNGTAPGQGSPDSLAVDPAGKFVYVAYQQSDNVILTYAINAATGELTLASSSFKESNGFSSIAVHPNGNFAYATVDAGGVAFYAIDRSTGALTQSGSTGTGQGPTAIAVDPSGKFAYVANLTSNDISAYTINSTTGRLTLVGTGYAGGSAPCFNHG